MREGTRLAGGRYVVEAPIAAGAMGAVARAQRDDGLEVAVKRLTDPRQAERFEIEARLLTRLDHPRVSRVLDYFEEGGESYIVMALVRGWDLRRRLAAAGRPGLPVDEAIRHTLHACEALHYVHAQHVVHRDVKPQNLVEGEDGVVLVDFGIARDTPQTTTATVGIGTPGYVAPEVLVRGAVSPRSDVYGLAATLWALLTGAPPAIGEARPLSSLVAGAGSRLDAALRAGLAIDPTARIPSAAAFAAALDGPLASAGGASLARTVESPRLAPEKLGEVARAIAGLLHATAVSLAFMDETTGELVFEAAWGAGAHQIVGMRIPPGTGIAGAALASGGAIAVPDCRSDPRFAGDVAERTGYMPRTIIAVPLRIPGLPVGVLSALDRADGAPFTSDDLEAAAHATALAVVALSSGGGSAATAPA